MLWVTSVKRVSNTLVTFLQAGHNSPKGELIPDSHAGTKVFACKDLSLEEGPMAYQLVGEVTAHQGYDG